MEVYFFKPRRSPAPRLRAEVTRATLTARWRAEFFSGKNVARFRSIGSGRRAAQPQPPKDTARTLKIQRAACYSRVSGYVNAHLAPVKNRSFQRVARIRFYTGKITQG